MWNGIKLFLGAFIFFSLLSAPVHAQKVGDLMGHAVGTDIVAYINNNPLPSYNINGHTAVLASDLDGYGFIYNYNNYLRRADLRFVGGDITPLQFWRDKTTYGLPVANVLYTDIEVYFDGVRIPSFNVDGLTAVYFSDLAPYGELSYDDELRAAFLNIPSMDMAEFAAVEDRSTAVAALHYFHTGGRYSWDFTLHIPVSLYDSYRAIDRAEIGVNNYAAYASDPGDDIYISALADGFMETARTNSLSDRECVDMVIDFVQSFRYADDRAAKNAAEYPNFTIETLFEKQGDCEDTSILLACILKELGYDAVLLAFVDGGDGHMAVGVRDDGTMTGTCFPYGDSRYFYVETTGPGWEIGVVPLEQQGQGAYIIEF